MVSLDRRPHLRLGQAQSGQVGRPDDDAIAARNQVVVRLDLKVYGQILCLLANATEDFTKRLEPVLQDEVTDGL